MSRMTQLHDTISSLVEICHANLRNSKESLKYLVRERGMTKQDLVLHKVGFFPQNLDTLRTFLSKEDLIKFNIINSSDNSDFSDFHYLIFPIFDEYNKPVGISGRTLMLDEDRKLLGVPKYKNSSYKKANILYGLNFSKKHILKSNNVYVIEGYFDLISMMRNGFNNSVAICGTAFSKQHFIKLSRYSDTITFILDADDAGRKSAERIHSNYLNKGMKLKFLVPPEPFKDVDEYFRCNSAENFLTDFEEMVPSGW